MANPLFPDVPNLPGVPALLRKASPITDGLGNLSHLSNLVNQLLGGVDEKWGVFDEDGNDLINADSFVSIEYRNGSRLLDYPVEDGSFESYNKVANPFDAAVTFAKGGTQDERQAFLTAIDALNDSLDLVSVVTPEVSYDSVNLERYDYRRVRENGSHLLLVTLYFREIRLSAEADGQNATQAPDGADATSNGQVSAASPVSGVKAALSSAASGLKSVQGAMTAGVSRITGSIKTATMGIL